MFGRSCSVSAAFCPAPRRLFIDDAGLLPLLDVADDDAIADHHLQRVDRAARRQRIDVDRLDPVLRRVAENLRDAGADRGAGDGEIDIDAEPRGVGITVLGLQQQRAGAGIAWLDEGGLQASRPTSRARSSKIMPQIRSGVRRRFQRRRTALFAFCATGAIACRPGFHRKSSFPSLPCDVFVVREISGNARCGASGMIGIVQPPASRGTPPRLAALCGFVMVCASGRVPKQAEQG